MTRRIALVTIAAALTAAAQQIPRPAGPFSIMMNSGKSIQVADYKGKGVILAFILTTCSHCQATTRLLTRLQAEYGPKGLQVLESAIDEGAAAFVPGFIQQFGPTFPVGYNQFPSAQAFMQHSPMKIMHMPGLVFIDRKGTIVAQYEGSDKGMEEGVQEKTLRAEIEKILKPAAPASASTSKKASPKK
jgi:cytochrome oxidase Cu insertion factor (SCO1/SenC/PrrC family)